MLAWISANLINIALVVLIVLIVCLLLRGMIRDRKAGKTSCGCNCASCGTCNGCSKCCTPNYAANSKRVNGISGKV